MTIRHMRIFLEVYRSESVTKAAAALHMTQPAVTRAVQEIESYYGVPLFDRIGRRLYVTESGRQYYAQALHIVEALDAMETGLRNWESTGLLRVGATVTLGSFLLPELAAKLRAQQPGVRLKAMIANGAALQQALLENRLDLAIIEGSVTEQELHTEVFATDRLILIVPPNSPLAESGSVSLQQLTTYDLLLREQGSAGRSFVDGVFAAEGLTAQPMWESISTQALIRAVHQGLGVSILPERMVQKDCAEGFVCSCTVENAPFVRNNYVVWHKNKYLTPAAQLLIASCRAYKADFA